MIRLNLKEEAGLIFAGVR